MSKRTFDDLRKQSIRRQGVCPVCNEEIPQGAERGRVQITLVGLTYISGAGHNYSQKKKQATHKQKTRNIAATTRIVCESCAIELYEQLVETLPMKQTRSDDG